MKLLLKFLEQMFYPGLFFYNFVIKIDWINYFDFLSLVCGVGSINRILVTLLRTAATVPDIDVEKMCVQKLVKNMNATRFWAEISLDDVITGSCIIKRFFIFRRVLLISRKIFETWCWWLYDGVDNVIVFFNVKNR